MLVLLLIRIFPCAGIRPLFAALCEHFIVTFFVQMGDGNPGMGHLIGCPLARTNPLVRIRVTRIIRRVVIPCVQNDGRTGWNQWLVAIFVGMTVVPTGIPVRGLLSTSRRPVSPESKISMDIPYAAQDARCGCQLSSAYWMIEGVKPCVISVP